MPKAGRPDDDKAYKWQVQTLRHPVRQRIFEAVQNSPGIIPQGLAAQLASNRSTVRYHLARLQAAGLVRTVAFHQRTHLFATASLDAREQDALAVLQRGRTWDLVREVARNPGRPQCVITHDLKLSRKLLRKYVDRLLQLGLIEEVHQPPYLVYYPTQRLKTMVQAKNPEPTEAGATPVIVAMVQD